MLEYATARVPADWKPAVKARLEWEFDSLYSHSADGKGRASP